MKVKSIILCAVLAVPFGAKAQLSAERAALSSLLKKRWEHAYEQAHRLLQKDSVQPAARYAMALYFIAPENPRFQADSARYYAATSLYDFEKSPARVRERVKRLPLDSLIIQSLRREIDSVAFNEVKAKNTTEAYNKFLMLYTDAVQRPDVTRLRDEAGFADATSTNSYQAFEQFIARYPEAAQASLAKGQYEKLLYEDKTRDKRLASYRQFLQQYPASRYRDDAERNVLEISTASGSIADYESFLNRYANGAAGRKARAVLYHLVQDDQRHPHTLPAVLLNDSVQAALQAEEHYLVPYLHQGTFGFMDSEGQEVVQVDVEELDKEYQCGNITEDVLVLPDRLVSRRGATLYQGKVHALEDIGLGFLLIENETCQRLLHKSGFFPGDSCVADARILAGKFLAIQKDNQWGVFTLTGRQLVPYGWDELSMAGDVVVFRKGSKFWLATAAQLAAEADLPQLKFNDAFDEVKLWPQGRVWVRAGKFQGVFERSLSLYIPFKEDQQLTSVFFGGAARSSFGWTLYNTVGTSAGVYDTAIIREPWVGTHVQASKGWKLVQPTVSLAPVAAYDSVFFTGPFAAGLKGDSITIHFPGKGVWKGLKPLRLEFVPGQDSSAYLLMHAADKKTLYNQQGQKLFVVAHDRVQHAGGNLFIVFKKEKKGLVTSDGKLLLPVEYDAIGTVQKGIISLLKAMKFGLFDVAQKKLVKTEYTKNLVPYNRHTVIAFKNRLYGWVTWDNKPSGDFEFNEIIYWSDSVALVKKDHQWMLYDLYAKKAVLDKIKDYKIIRDNAAGKLAIVHQENYFGVVDSQKGVVIPVKFSDIVNVGSAEVPLYFTEKHVEEASIFVVIYYNHRGELLRKEVYEAEEYEKIYCADHK